MRTCLYLFVIICILNIFPIAGLCDIEQEEPEPQWIGQYGGILGDYVIEDGLTYVAEGPYLAIYDVGTGKVNDRMIGRILVASKPEDYCYKLQVVNDVAFMAYGEKGVAILDIRDRHSPCLLKWLITPGNAKGLAIKGALLAVAADMMGLQLYDISDARNPVLLGIRYMSGDIREVAIADNYALVKGLQSPMSIFDITDPTQPEERGQLSVRNIFGEYPPHDSCITAVHWQSFLIIIIGIKYTI